VVVSVLTVLAGAALAAVALAAGGSKEREATSPGDEAAQLLRLNDLPLGYLTVPLFAARHKTAECERLTNPGDTPAKMAKFIERFHPRGCIFGFQQLFPDPGAEPGAGLGPLSIGTGVLEAGSKAEADAGWAVVPEILGRLLNDHPPKPAPTPLKLGSATRLFHASARIFSGGGKRTPITFLVWRTGNTLAAVMTTGRSREVDDAAAALLARKQQAHIAKPTRLRAIENYDAEVALEDPGLDLPVYWLGRRFAAGNGVTEAGLKESWSSDEATAERETDSYIAAPTARLQLTYAHRVDWDLSIWGPEDWPIYARSKSSKVLTTWKCTRKRTLEAPGGGTATIYLGYDEDYAKCPSYEPGSATAWVKFGEDTVVVNQPFASVGPEPESPWGSFAAMEAIVKGLRLRMPPAR